MKHLKLVSIFFWYQACFQFFLVFNPGEFQVKKKQFMKHCFSKTYKLSELCISKSAKYDIQALNFNGFFKQSDTAKRSAFIRTLLISPPEWTQLGYLLACQPHSLRLGFIFNITHNQVSIISNKPSANGLSIFRAV